jgi:hypothetical protein
MAAGDGRERQVIFLMSNMPSAMAKAGGGSIINTGSGWG